MVKRKHGVSLQAGATTDAAFLAGAEDVDPNSFLTNIADCMLVLMVGLFVALIAQYNIQLDQSQEEIVGTQVNMDEDGDSAIDERYQEAGTVYYDEETGQYYLLPN